MHSRPHTKGRIYSFTERSTGVTHKLWYILHMSEIITIALILKYTSETEVMDEMSLSRALETQRNNLVAFRSRASEEQAEGDTIRQFVQQ